jgi:hypothetical protein
MKKLIMMSTGFLVLASAMMLAGCAPLPNQGHCEYGVEIVYVPVPVPYPSRKPVGMRGRGGSDRPPEQIASSTPKRPLLKRR